MNNNLPELRIYISFVMDDYILAQPCAQLLQSVIKAGLNSHFNTIFFSPNETKIGEKALESLAARIEESDIAIVLISHSYLNESDEAQRVYIKHPHPIIIELEPVIDGASFAPFDRNDVAVERSFSEGDNTTDKIKFASQVTKTVRRVLIERKTHHPVSLPALSPREIAEQLIATPLSEFTVKTVPSRATRGFGAAGRADNGSSNDASASVTDIVEELVGWSRTPSSDQPRLCALLGDVGTGKTTTSILVACRLLELRKKGEPVPFPFYFDLRKISPNGLDDFGLHVLLTKFLAGYSHQFTSANEILEIIHNENTLVIFDGLDEVLVHLSLSDGQRLTRSLLDALNLNDSDSGDMTPHTRLLLSCRTQYFRTFEDEASFFDHDETHHKGDNKPLILTLLPFDEDQIQEYLRRNVPHADVGRFLETIRSVHNLRELASQPLLLNMIREVLLTVDDDLGFGQQVRSVNLYERFVSKWLRRDDGKQSLIPEHKIQLMTHLAWQVWRSGSRTWSARWMETWMLQFLHDHPDMELDYKERMPDQWKQDFRTATFLTRRRDDFSFAHSSLLEYFLAKHLADSLTAKSADKALAAWDITRPSDETFAFFTELIESLDNDARDRAIARLEYVGKHASVTARENIFAYTLRAIRQGKPHPHPDALVLSDTDLRGLSIGSKQTHLNLSGVLLRGARLDDAHIINTNLDRTDATGTSMRRTLIEHCTLTHTNLTDADLTGTIFRHCNIKGASLEQAKRYRTQLLHTTGYQQQLTDVLTAPLPEHSTLQPLSLAHILGGHSGHVRALKWSPDGHHILTGSQDATARIWDAATGENTLTLTHNTWVRAVAWSPDGHHILTGSQDGITRIWDATTGKNTLTLTHTDWVTAVAWSPDGHHILTGSEDRTTRVWDAETGENTLTLTHNTWVRTVAWSPDGHHILTGSSDGTARIWDATTGTNTLTTTHSTWVRAVAWSPDGHHILTGSGDGTARIWDATTGTNTLTLTHTDWVTAVAWSPDGHHILTGSQDATARIWDATTGTNTLTLRHTDWVRAVAWSPDGHHILTGSQDATARIWDAETGEPVRFMFATLPEGECAVLSADHTRVIGASLYAWRWLGRYAKHPDGTLERIPIEIDGSLPPLSHNAETE